MTELLLSLVQLVAGVTIANQHCPGLGKVRGLYASCYVPSARTIYLARQDRGPQRRFVVLHEYGHAYDIDALSDQQRARFQHRLGYRAARGWWEESFDHWPPAEAFANAYAACAMGDGRTRICELLPPSPLASVLRATRH